MNHSLHGGDIYRHPGVLDFSANLNPLGPPPCVTEAVRESAARVSVYPDTEAAALLSALAETEGVPQERLILGNGAAELIYALVQAARPGRALLAVPTFSEYARALAAAGCEAETVRLRREEDFRLGEDFPARITEGTDLLFLCQPNNPTGQLIEPALLREIYRRCRATKTLLVTDECFLDFAEDGAAYSLRDHTAEGGLFVLKAFTKRFAMPGLRLGYGICGDAELLAKMRGLLQPWNISVPAQAAGEAALTQAPDWAEQAQPLLAAERDYLARALSDAGFAVLPSAANYLFFFGTPGLGEKMLEEKILIRDCANYEGLEAGDYRIAVRAHAENERFVAALARCADRNEGEKR